MLIHKLLLAMISSAILISLVGCGSKEQTPEEVNVVQDADKKIKPKSIAAPVLKKRESKAQKKVAKAKPKIKAKPEDLFVEANPIPNFQIMKIDLEQRNRVEISIPPDEYGTASYRVIKEGSQGKQNKSSNFELPEGFTAIPEFGYADDGMPLRIMCQIDESEMAYIPAGVAVIGSRKGPSETSPVLAVELDPYYIDINEVTLDQFQLFLEKYRGAGQKSKAEPTNIGQPGDYPVLGIKWHEARKYGIWTGKMLPTESQWERAARGTEGFDYVWGEGRPTWSKKRILNQIDPIQSFPRDMTEEGVFDMAGNAMEWCRDDYRADAFADAAKKAAGTVLQNWTGPKSSEPKGTHVIKGNGPDWVAWHRAGQGRDERSDKVGFRCVLQLEQKKEKEDDSK